MLRLQMCTVAPRVKCSLFMRSPLPEFLGSAMEFRWALGGLFPVVCLLLSSTPFFSSSPFIPRLCNDHRDSGRGTDITMGTGRGGQP